MRLTEDPFSDPGPCPPSTSEDGLPIDALLARRVSVPWRRVLSVLLSPTVMRVAGPLGLAQSMATEASRAVAVAPLLIYLSFRDGAPSVDAQVQEAHGCSLTSSC